MTYTHILEIAAHWAAIITAVLAGLAYGQYLYERCRKRRHLERYLKKEKEKNCDKGQRTLIHLVANVGMTKAEILDAAFRSKRIRRRVKTDCQNMATDILLEYNA